MDFRTLPPWRQFGKNRICLGSKNIRSPTGKSKWNREALNKLLSNEKYTGWVLLQKTVSAGVAQIKNNGLINQYLYADIHEAIISDEMFMAVQQEKFSRSR
ncbi:recombinase family protein [Pseudoflavonifractor sp. 60]|uniref:recombinase family protein n=1 Tax=Pseudoflavonifractor sp. 60 TaxID=2304576 RepID=UPI001FAC922E|nr:recombinase family protein [Pseudoflavonifractor sp. 60]